MSRFPIEPHFVYSQGSDTIVLPSWQQQHASDPYMPNSNLYDSVTIQDNIFLPEIQLPSLGNTHTHRRGNRITVTSIRVKLSLRMAARWCYAYQPNNDPSSEKYTDTQLPQLAPARRFFKMRFMVVQFNDDMTITPLEIAKWFFRTYCYFKNDERHIQSNDYPCEEPVSVHSNIMRLTTPYTGKFNILMDKPFTWYTSNPLNQLDINIPLNKSFVFSEEEQDKLLFPNIWMFMLPPLNMLTDMDPLTRQDLFVYWGKSSAPSSYQTVWPFVNVNYFAKLNFVDL